MTFTASLRLLFCGSSSFSSSSSEHRRKHFTSPSTLSRRQHRGDRDMQSCRGGAVQNEQLRVGARLLVGEPLRYHSGNVNLASSSLKGQKSDMMTRQFDTSAGIYRRPEGQNIRSNLVTTARTAYGSGDEKRRGIVVPSPRHTSWSTTAVEQQPPQPRLPHQTQPRAAVMSTTRSLGSLSSSSSSLGVTKNTHSNKPLPPIPEPLSRAALLSTLNTFHDSLSHTRYAVSGIAALSVWGYTGRLPTRVTVMCCPSDKEIIRAWAKVAGWHLYPSTPEIIGLPSQSSGKKTVIRRIRLRGSDASERPFDAAGQERVVPLDLLHHGQRENHKRGTSIIPTQAYVLTPVALLNQFAHSYLVEIQRAQSPDSLSATAGSTTTTTTLHRERTRQQQLLHTQRAGEIASLIIWILERMDSTLQLVSQQHRTGRSVEERLFIPPRRYNDIMRLLPHVINIDFRTAFDRQFPGAVHLWTRCGLDIDMGTIYHPGFSKYEPQYEPLRPRQTQGQGGGGVRGGGRFRSRSRSSSPPQPDQSISSSSNTTGPSSLDSSFTASGKDGDHISLTEWQLPDDLKMMMDQATAEYHIPDEDQLRH